MVKKQALKKKEIWVWMIFREKKKLCRSLFAFPTNPQFAKNTTTNALKMYTVFKMNENFNLIKKI